MVFMMIFCTSILCSCEESFESQLRKVRQSSGSQEAKKIATAIVYSKYNKEMSFTDENTFEYQVFNLLEQCNFWSEKNYFKLNFEINSSRGYAPMTKTIVTDVLNLKFKKNTVSDYSRVQDVIDVLIKSGVFTSSSKQKEENDIVILCEDSEHMVCYCSNEKNVITLLSEFDLDDEWKSLRKQESEKEENNDISYIYEENNGTSYIYFNENVINNLWYGDKEPQYNDGYYLDIYKDSYTDSGSDVYELSWIGYYVFTKRTDLYNYEDDIEDNYLDLEKCWLYW
jgi:hypothetical protein